jgi:DNA repair protein RecO
MATRSVTISGIVLKRSNTGETDRIVTILSLELGKVVVVAKGVRKLHSSKAAVLEPGNYVQAFCIHTSSLPLLTQATLLADTGSARESLAKMRQLHQFLEIVDQLFVEEEIDPELFAELLGVRKEITSPTSSVQKIRRHFEKILTALGFHVSGTQIDSVLDKVSELTERPIRSFEFLLVKPHKD